MTLKQMQAEVAEVNERHDWGNGEPVPFATAMANLHGEVSEAWEAWRKWGLSDATGPVIHQFGCRAEIYPEQFCNSGCKAKPEGVGSEFADILIRLLDDCERYGVDLDAEYARKIAYNRTRPFKHGNKRA